MGSFYQYLKEQAHRDDIVGDCARDAMRDPDRPHGRSSPETWRKYIEGKLVDDVVMEALELAIEEYVECGGWTKNGAVTKMRKNKLLQEILKVESRIKNIIEQAKSQKIEPGYNRIDRYTQLRDNAYHLVGFAAENPSLRTNQHYEVVIDSIADLLPPDRVDLYPEGAPDFLDI